MPENLNTLTNKTAYFGNWWLTDVLCPYLS
jgi:hypothetical protein